MEKWIHKKVNQKIEQGKFQRVKEIYMYMDIRWLLKNWLFFGDNVHCYSIQCPS